MQSSPSLRKVPRELVEYAMEPLDQFTNVFDEVKLMTSASGDAWKVHTRSRPLECIVAFCGLS